MLGLFSFSRIQMYIAVAIAVSGIYFYWKHQIEQQALMEYNQKQLEQIVKDQEAFANKMTEVDQKQQAIETDLVKQNEEINNQLKDIQAYLYSTETKALEKPASAILKNTVNQIKGGVK